MVYDFMWEALPGYARAFSQGLTVVDRAVHAKTSTLV